MTLNEMTMYLLGEYLIDSTDNLDEFYNDSMELLRGAADEKEIEFDEYFRTRWKDSADTIVGFDELYFSDTDKRNLYVFLSAQVDKDIFEYLSYVWSKVYNEELTIGILKEQVHKLINEGKRF